MFLIDDLVLAPAKGIFWIFKEIHNAVEQEMAGESDAITAALTELYMKLDTGQITEAEFEDQEKVLLDHLDRLQTQQEDVVPKKKAAKSRRKPKKAANSQVTP